MPVKIVLCFALILASTQPGIDTALAEGGDARELFSRANSLKIKERYEESLALFLKVAEESSQGRLAEDALAKAGRLCDYNLFDIGSAIRYYGLFLERYPSSRSAKKIRERYEYLKTLPEWDHEPYRVFHRAKHEHWDLQSGNMTAALEDLLERHPDFSEADEVLFLLGNKRVEGKQYDQGRGYFEELVKRFPGSELASRAQAAMGDSYFVQGRYKAALEAYEAMRRYPGDYVEETIQTRVERVKKHVVRFRIFIVAALFLSLSILVLVVRIPWGGFKISFRFVPITETALIVVIISFFEWMARGMSSAIRYSILFSGLSVIPVLMLNALHIETSRMSRAWRFVNPLHIVLMVVSIVFIVFHFFDMTVAFEDVWKEAGRMVYIVRSFLFD